MKQHIISKPIHLLWIALIVVSPLLGGCQKEKLPDEIRTLEDAYRAIVGEWEWEETIIQYRGQDNPIYETPDTENKTIRYVFRKNGTAVRIKNGSDFIDYKFEIKSITMEPGDFYLTLSPIDKNIQVSAPFLIFYNGDLILTNGLGSSSYYIRK